MAGVGKPPAGSRGAWKTKGISDWNHATELLKHHADCQWHRDATVPAVWHSRRRVGSLCLSCIAEVLLQVAERRQRNPDVLLKMFY